MKILLAFFSLFFSTKQSGAQKIIERYAPQKDSLRIGFGKTDFLSYNEKGYTLVLPDAAVNTVGVLVSLEDRRADLNSHPAEQIYREAVAKNFAVLYLSTGIPVDLFFSAQSLVYVDTVLRNAFAEHRLPDKNVFFLGVNLSGHRALKYVQYCLQKSSNFVSAVKGVVLCDGVLDWVRQWYEGKKAVRDKAAESSVFEGKLITYLLEKALGGTPKNKLENYLKFSPYSYFDEKNRHINDYKNFSVRAYTEPASHYWLNEKGKTTFDTNFPDMVGIINELKLAGNTKSELIIFTQNETNADRRNPNYTWGLVDKAELMNWIVAQTR